MSGWDRKLYKIEGVDAQGDIHAFATDDLQRAIEMQAQLKHELDVKARIISRDATVLVLSNH